MSAKDERGKIVEVLRDRVDEDSAEVVEDYSWGSHKNQHVTMRHWVETAASGRYKGQMRLVHQSTNPRRDNTVWFKPQRGQYGNWFMFLVRYENGHVDGVGLSTYLTGERWVAFYNSGIWEFLNEKERGTIAYLLRRYNHGSPNAWADWHAKVDEVWALSIPTLDEWKGLNEGRYVNESDYEQLRTYLEMGGPDIRAAQWWGSTGRVVDLDAEAEVTA
ncbi:hypothetical protein [Nocardia brasiliensis]|uniref:hypothetical protein n=1 Tax=Nocardia brasiliensis TaxID=37326 RepID=UPI0024537CD6|nr:hypothetical protein [Nocardia brasiliensis]